MPERRHLAEELRQDVLSSDQELDRLDTRDSRGLDEIFAFDGKQSGLEAVPPCREKLSDEPELLVLTGLDQAACEPGSASSAAFARSATAANA